MKFWRWFETIEMVLAEDLMNERYVGTIDEKIQQFFPQLSWEIGPGLMKKLFLAFSPNLDGDLLPLTKQIVALAPELSNWEFYSARPRRDWNLQWEMDNERGHKIIVDANKWEYVLYEFDGDIYEIDVRVIPKFSENEDVLYAALEIALLGELGELTYMTKIDGAGVVDEWDQEIVGKETKLPMLRKHLLEMDVMENLN